MNKRAPRTSRSLSLVPQLKFPKEVNTYCPKCGHHTAHSVTVYKAGKARSMAWGSRRQERRKHGYGGQKFPELKRTAKTDRKSTRLNSSHLGISYAVFCLKKKNTT